LSLLLLVGRRLARSGWLSTSTGASFLRFLTIGQHEHSGSGQHSCSRRHPLLHTAHLWDSPVGRLQIVTSEYEEDTRAARIANVRAHASDAADIWNSEFRRRTHAPSPARFMRSGCTDRRSLGARQA